MNLCAKLCYGIYGAIAEAAEAVERGLQESKTLEPCLNGLCKHVGMQAEIL